MQHLNDMVYKIDFSRNNRISTWGLYRDIIPDLSKHSQKFQTTPKQASRLKLRFYISILRILYFPFSIL